MIVRKLDITEHGKTRELWEIVFPADTKKFLDYYYRFMTDHNEIYAIEKAQEIVSMIHLNPYKIQLVGKIFPIRYIVGVATKEEFRGQGMMGTLLKKVLRDMYHNEEPLIYLMPHAEAIYTPYEFVVVGEQICFEYMGDMEDGMFVDKKQGLEFAYATEEDCDTLEAFANGEFVKKYAVFTRRTSAYFSQLMKEQESQNGGIVLIYKEGDLVGYFLTANEGYQQVRELVVKHGIQIPLREKRRIHMMARATCVEKLLLCTNWHAGKRHIIQVVDPIIKENTGTYQLSPSYGGLQCKKISDEVEADKAWSIAELTKKVLSYELDEEKVLLNEVV